MRKEISINLLELEKTFQKGFKLHPINSTFMGGQVIGFLGKNGAGKSTLFQLISGNYESTSGSVYIAKEKLTPENFNLKRKFGYLPQNPCLPEWISGKEILNYAAALHQLSPLEKVVEASLSYWDCNDFQDKPLATCSHGMQKRIGLALATIHDPDYLILDEPFSGLDLFHIENLDKLIKKRQKQKTLTILSTHITPYLAKLCDNVFILINGKSKNITEWKTLDYNNRIIKIKELFFNQTLEK